MRAEYAVESGQEQHLSRHSQATAEAPTSEPCPLEETPALEPLSAVRARLLSCLRSRLPHRTHPPDWELLLEQTEDFADIEIRYGYYWRDGYGGVLPSGYDASSVAAEAVAELLTEQQLNGLVLEPHLLRRDLKKRARRIINRLHHRMENRIMLSKPKDQARKLKLPVRHIQDLQRRLRRKLAAHGYVPSSWKSRIQANYFHV